jgi:NadR type nicotinamide-nucleotide adenylyltransferase
MIKRICLHGPESTGKSTLATHLAAHFGCEVVPEFGRAYCEAHGTDIGIDALIHIAETQDAMNRAAAARSMEADGNMVLFDTDPLITAVWADMMFGDPDPDPVSKYTRDPWFDDFSGYADLYLLLDIDLPFINDGLRVYSLASDRQHFFDLCKAELDNRGVQYALIQGEGDARFDAALEVIAAA